MRLPFVVGGGTMGLSRLSREKVPRSKTLGVVRRPSLDAKPKWGCEAIGWALSARRYVLPTSLSKALF
jgi:hypothetical protein